MPLPPARLAALAAALALAPAAARAGDPVAGAAQWRQCRACHMITGPEGETIQRGGRVGPNLYGIVGRNAGSSEDFRYSAPLEEAGRQGLVWTEESFVAYVENPTGFLRGHSGNSAIRSPMNYQMHSGAADVFAYLRSLQE